MEISFDSEMKARFVYSMSKYVFLSIQINRFVFIRRVEIWFGFTCQQVPPPPRYLSRSKCQLLTVSRNAYKTLVEERVRVNSTFVRTTIDQQAVESLPENGVPQQLIDCGVHMPEVDKYAATRCGPGTVRDPLDATAEDDDASDEVSDAASSEGHAEDADRESPSSAGQPASKTSDLQLNQFETPLGLDPTSTPNYVQHVAAFKASGAERRRSKPGGLKFRRMPAARAASKTMISEDHKNKRFGKESLPKLSFWDPQKSLFWRP
jgi:hypothetical protein